MGEPDDGQFLDPNIPSDRSRSHSRSSSGRRRSPNLVSWSAGDVLHKATALGDVDTVVKTLRASSGCVNAKEPGGRTALHEAADCGRTAIVNVLLEHGADINARSFTEYTPLTFAAEHGHIEIMLALIERGADLNVASTAKQIHLRGQTPLHRAAFRGNLKAV